MPQMPGGNFVPQSVLQQGQVGGMSALSQGGPNPAHQVNAQPSAGPGAGGAATAEGVQAQLPQAQQAAGMAPAAPPPGQGAPPGQPPAQPGAPSAPGQAQAPPPPMPGFVPNSQGQQLYPPGQGPVTEKVPSLQEMGGQTIAPEPRGAQDVPLDANAQAGMMELQASARDVPEDVFETLGNVFGEYLKGPSGRGKGLLGSKMAQAGVLNEKTGKESGVGRCEAGGLLTLVDTLPPTGLLVGKQSDFWGDRVSRMADRRDPDGTSEQPWDVAQRDGHGDEDDDDVEDPSDLEEEGDEDGTDVYEPRHESAPYDDNGKPRPSWLNKKESREFVPGEDCAGCGASMEKSEEGYCNSCGCEYDTGKTPAKGRYHEGKQASKGLLSKAANVIGSHGVPMVSTEGDMQQSTAGEGDTSSLLVAPWSQNGADAWKDLNTHSGKGAGKGISTFGGELDKQAMDDCYANAYNCGEGCECAKAKEKQARVEPLPRWAPPGPPKAFPGMKGQPGVENFLTSLGLGLDDQGYVKQAMIGDNGQLTPDPFGGGMILGQQNEQPENPMDNPGTLLEAGTDDSQQNTTMQPGDHGMHDATAGDVGYNEAQDSIPLNGMKLGAFASGFLRRCLDKGLVGEEIQQAAIKCAQISDTIAEELSPLTKAAFVKAIGGMLSGLGRWGAKAAPFADDAARAAAGASRAAPPPSSASRMWQAASNGMGAAKQFAQPAAQTAAKTWQGASPTMKSFVTRTAVGTGVGGARDAYDYSQGNDYQGYAGQYGLLGGGSALLGVPGMTRQSKNIGVLGGTPFMRNWVGNPMGGAATGYGAGWVGDQAIYGMTGEDPGLRNYAAIAGGLGRTPFHRFLPRAQRGGLLNNPAYKSMRGFFDPDAAMGLMTGKNMGTAQRVGGALGVAELAGMATGAGSQRQGATDTMNTMANHLGVPTTDQAGNQIPAEQLGQHMAQALPQKAMEMVGQDPRVQSIAQQFGAIGEDGQVDFDKLATMAEQNAPLMQQLQQLTKGDGKLAKSLQSLGVYAAGPDGQMDLGATINNVTQLTDQWAAFKNDPMGQMMSMVGDWFKNMGPAGQILTIGGVVALIGGLMGGGSSMGLLGAGAAALGASGYGDQLAGMMGFGGGGGQQPQQPDPQQQPAAPPATSQADQAVIQQQAQAQGPVDEQQVATGEAPPQGFDAGAAMQNLLPQVQQILPDVTSEEIAGLMQQLGENADQVFDMSPQDLAGMITALRQRGG